jgi:hypothetical protein
MHYSNLSDGACPDVKFIHQYGASNQHIYPVTDQKLSNACRKMIRNISFGNSVTPDIQYFAASRAEADAKLAVLDTAEVTCVGIDDINNDPYRAAEQFYVQASAPMQLVTGN